MRCGISCSMNRSSSMSSQDRLITEVATHPPQHPVTRRSPSLVVPLIGTKTPPAWVLHEIQLNGEGHGDLHWSLSSCRGCTQRFEGPVNCRPRVVDTNVLEGTSSEFLTAFCRHRLHTDIKPGSVPLTGRENILRFVLIN